MDRKPVLLLISSCALLFGQSIPPAYDQPFRPQFHFSPREHWTNDPNGLVYFEGEYHLFFQYNPFGDQWGHMSWGHAVSSDMLHWKQLPVALPEEKGVMIFTGSTVIDEHNTSGFCTGGKPCMVAIYTGHTSETKLKKALQTQNLAFSNDRGRTWTKYSGNPVLNLNMTDFRDPKVFWSAQSKRWIMAVSLPNDHKVRVYGSGNLTRWTAISEFGPAGATGGQWECPELFQLPVEGRKESRWVLKIGLNPGGREGGSGEQYFVGEFDGIHFKNDNPPSLTLWSDYGKDCYCALTFNGLPKNQSQVMIGWMDNWDYAAKLPTSPFRGQMTVPRKLTLRATPDGIRLIQQPLDGLQTLRGEKVDVHGSVEGTGHSFQLTSTIAVGAAMEVGWKLLEGAGAYTSVGYDRAKGMLFMDRSHSGETVSKEFAARIEAPFKLRGDVLHLDIVVDRDSVEVFSREGSITMTNLVFPPADAQKLEFYSAGGKEGDVTASLWKLRSTW